MRSTFAIWTFSFVACGNGAEPTKLPPVVASMDYVSKTVGTNHTCVDIFDATLVEGWATFCKRIDVGERDKCTFHRGKACAVEDHHGGCLQRDGSITWLLAGETSCVLGLSFPGEAPPPTPAKPFHCKGGASCEEMTSVFDLVPTVEARNCATAGGTFGAGACPSEGAVGRCLMEGDVDRETMVIYAPAPLPQAKAMCASIKGEWL